MTLTELAGVSGAEPVPEAQIRGTRKMNVVVDAGAKSCRIVLWNIDQFPPSAPRFASQITHEGMSRDLTLDDCGVSS